MRCKKIQEMLKLDYLDGVVNPVQKNRIEEHLAACAQCSRLAEELKAQHQLFRAVERKKVPESLWFKIRDAIIWERVNQESAVPRFLLRPVPALVTVFAATAFIFVLTATFINFNKSNVREGLQGYSLNGDNEVFLHDLGTNIEEYFL